MRRTIVVAVLVGAVTVAAVLVLKPSPSPAEPSKGELGTAAPLKPAGPALPVSQVVLFSSGVGYFQREGEVEGSGRIDLTFPVQDVNDLLKSMVLQDLGGGHIAAVSYDSHDPIDKTLKSFAVNLTTNPSLAQILDQARGEKVEVVLQQTQVSQPGTLTGAVIGVEKQKQPAGKDGAVDMEILNLWCAEGIRSVKLSDLQRVRFLNPVLDNEFRQALETLALSHDTQKKAVSISFAGEGKRTVRVGYVIENPIWKTSYRLVLDKKEGKPFLQGWAIVENPSDEDWAKVRMALVSGRPISFQMDLYQPLYVPRPTVEPELFASLRPQTYSGDMGRQYGMAGESKAAEKPGADRAGARMRGVAKKELEDASRMQLAAPAEPAALAAGGGGLMRERLAEKMNLQQGVQSAASAGQLGDFFQYVLERPVSLQRQKSAMLPIVHKDVEGTRVSIYNQGTHAKFPLLGLRFKNTTGLHLMQGPITVFEGSSYAGDARVLDLQPNEERLLSYAIDLGTEVEPVAKRAPDRLVAVKVHKGILYSTTKVRESKTYNVKNRSEHDRTVLIEHPFRPDFQLVSKEQPAERARDVYRFELKVPAGKTASQEVIEEHDQGGQVVLSNSDDQTIRLFINSTVSSPKVKDALRRALELKDKLSATQRDVQQLQRELNTITTDQQRLRANLREMPQTAAAYKRYLEKFDKQETEIEKLQADIKKLQDQEHSQRKDYEAYLAELIVE
jgi:hypothetical protein